MTTLLRRINVRTLAKAGFAFIALMLLVLLPSDNALAAAPTNAKTSASAPM